MKRVLFTLAVVAAVILSVSCAKYEDGRPEKSVRQESANMYNDAKDVEWEREGAYWKVSFETGIRPNRIDHEAWFDMSGNWVMTETELFLSYVPQDIKNHLAADPVFGASSVSDNEVEFLQKPDGNFYRFEVRHDGREVKVDVTEDGKVSLAR